MRKIAATYIFPVKHPPIKNGILICNYNGTIQEIVENNGELREESGLEYYSGIIVPGFVPFIKEAEKNKEKKAIEISIRKLWTAGIAAIGNFSDDKLTLPAKSIRNIEFHSVTEYSNLEEQLRNICLFPSNTNYFSENQHINEGYFKNKTNRISLGANNLTSIHKFSLLSKMKLIQHQFKNITLNEIVEWSTLNGALTIGIDNSFGSFEKDKNPGVNLISGVDFKQMKLTEKSKIKRIL